MSLSRAFTVATAAILLTACAPFSWGQSDFSGVEIKPEPLAPGVAVLFGAGGNIGVSYGEDGTVLIDDQFAPLTAKIQQAVTALGASPVKFLINTHWHFDHTGGNENLGKVGAVIMAHDNVRVRMNSEQKRGERVTPASPKAALPVVTYAEGVKLHLNGEEIRAIGLAPAHTDGDSMIHWTRSNVIHMGDTFFNKVTFPFIDLASGGDVHGVVAAADRALALANDDTKIIPGHGPVATKADLQKYRDMVAGVIGKVQAGINAGHTQEVIVASKPAAGYDIATDGFIKPDGFVETVYKSLGGRPSPQ